VFDEILALILHIPKGRRDKDADLRRLVDLKGSRYGPSASHVILVIMLTALRSVGSCGSGPTRRSL
jgi:hypothetical protein